MHPTYKQQLPARVLALVDEIEKAAGYEIEVIHDPEYTIEQSASITLPPTIRFRDSFAAVSALYPEPYAMATHELLHLRGTFVRNVPYVTVQNVAVQVDKSRGFATAAENGYVAQFSNLDAYLEHLVIEPELERLGFKLGYSHLAKFWADCPPSPGSMGNATGERWGLLLTWLETVFISRNPGAISRAENRLRGHGLLSMAVQIRRTFEALLSSPDPVAAKIGMVIAFAGYVGLDPNAIRLRYAFSDRPGMWRSTPLPDKIEVPFANGRKVSLGLRPQPHLGPGASSVN